MKDAETRQSHRVRFTCDRPRSIRFGVVGKRRVGAVILVGALVGWAGWAAQAGPPKDVKADLTKPFEHDSHLKQTKMDGDKKRLMTCADCHTLEQKAGASEYPICESPRMPYPNHDKCISCHPSSFFKPPIVICTNCHTQAAITEKAPLKQQTGASAPLRTVFNHRLHLDPKQRVKARFKMQKDCTFCHQFVKGGEKVRLPDHAQCCECHTNKDVEPNINDCAFCHSRPKKERNPRSKVRKFSHANHKTDPKTNKALECGRCHFDVPKAKKVAKMKLPKMATCVECHTGELAFSYAECLRCHEKGIESKLVPQSHQALQKKLKK